MIRHRFMTCAAVALLACCPSASSQTVHYVNAAATGDSTGATWADAFADLHDALALSQPGDEIWIAGGTYKPDRGTMDRDLRFIVPGGVSLYGGFAGWESSPDQRNVGSNETILSGDLAGDDGPTPCADVSNCCVRHEGFGCDDHLCETIVCNLAPWCCKGKEDPADAEWNGACVGYAHLHCCQSFGRNTCENSREIVEALPGPNVTRLHDLLITGAYYFGGMPAAGRGSVWINGGSLWVERCRFRNNLVAIWGKNADLTIVASEFLYNNATTVVSSPMTTIRESTFLGNLAGIASNWITTIEACRFEESPGGGAYFVDGDLAISESIIEGNQGSCQHRHGTAVYDRCVFANNLHGIFEESPAIFRDCVFRNNGVVGSISTSGNISMSNCMIVGNPRRPIYIDGLGNNVAFDNCLVTGNVLPIYVGNLSSITVRSSILWQNGPDSIGEIQAVGGAIVSVNNSIVEGWSGQHPGSGNTGLDPLFIDPLGPDGLPGTGDENYRLSPDSPAVNAGMITASTPGTDLDGHPRVLCGGLDVGAYEFGIGDSDCDGIVDLLDFQLWPACMTGPDQPYPLPQCANFDYDADGHIDALDFAAFSSALTSPSE